MRPPRPRGRSVPWPETPHRTERLADPVASARTISGLLPDAIEQAEAAGLSIIAQHLGKALHLARRVAASGDPAG